MLQLKSLRLGVETKSQKNWFHIWQQFRPTLQLCLPWNFQTTGVELISTWISYHTWHAGLENEATKLQLQQQHQATLQRFDERTGIIIEQNDRLRDQNTGLVQNVTRLGRDLMVVKSAVLKTTFFRVILTEYSRSLYPLKLSRIRN